MIDVAVLAGGLSPEHDISLLSASRALQRLHRDRWRPWPVYLDREGRWWPAQAPLAPDAIPDPGFRTVGMRAMRPGAALDHLLSAGIEVVLPILHGPFGEDGTVQGMLALHRVPFVGAGCAASAVAMDKIRTRECLRAHGVRMPRAHIPERAFAGLDRGAQSRAIVAAVGLPCFLKIDLSGSSLGVERAEDLGQVESFLRRFRHRAVRFLAEEEVRGEEITVSVLGNSAGELTALPAVGIYPVAGGHFTYEAKYKKGMCEEVIPPRGLDPSTLEAAGHLAVACHRALWCDGMSRTDMIATSSGLVVLELNTIPGLTETSLLPQAAAAAGMDYGSLLDRLLELALEMGHPTCAPDALAETAS